MIVPFVGVYTRGVTDVNYSRYIFAIIACMAELFYCLRISYTFMVQAIGAFAETKKYFYIEAVINIVLSVILVNFMGLVGIVTGTLMAMLYRTIVFARFVYTDVIKVSILSFWKRITTTVACIFLSCAIGLPIIVQLHINNYFQWFVIAILIAALTVIIVSVLHLLIYRKLFKKSVKILIGRIRK